MHAPRYRCPHAFVGTPPRRKNTAIEIVPALGPIEVPISRLKFSDGRQRHPTKKATRGRVGDPPMTTERRTLRHEAEAAAGLHATAWHRDTMKVQRRGKPASYFKRGVMPKALRRQAGAS